MSINVTINRINHATAIVDNRCCTYSIVTKEVVRTNNLPRIKIPQILVEGVNEQKSPVSVITEFTLDVGGLKQKATAYVIPSTYNYNIILGKT